MRKAGARDSAREAPRPEESAETSTGEALERRDDDVRFNQAAIEVPREAGFWSV